MGYHYLECFLGIINGFDVPTRQSLVREMVNDPSDLPNALVLNSSMVNLSKLTGITRRCFDAGLVYLFFIIIC